MSIDRFTRLYHLYTKKKNIFIHSFIRVSILVFLIGISSITSKLQAQANASITINSITGNCPSATISATITNSGTLALPVGTYVSIYDANPTTTAANLIGTYTTTVSIPASGTLNVSMSASLVFNTTTIYVVVNDKGTTNRPFNLSSWTTNTTVTESVYTNNIDSRAYSCTDTDGDGVADFFDLDDDNDGILDVVETNWCKPLTASTIIPVGKTYGVTAASFGSYLPAVTAGLDATTCMSPGQITTLTYEFGKTVNNPIIGFYGVDFAKEEWFDLNDNPVQLRILDASLPTSVTNNILTLSTSPVAGANTAATSAMGRVQVYGNVTGLKVKHTWLLTSQNCDSHGFSFLEPTECLGGPNPDTDGDGVVNSMDLDSDGDGCPDALEAGVNGVLTSGTVKNGLNGVVTSTINIASAIATGTYGANGLADGVETSTESGIITYTSKYALYALSKNIAACANTDGDGIADLFDIDDDNDGILDAEESPTCFMTANEWNTVDKTASVISITSALNTLSPNNKYSSLTDNDATAAAVQFSTATAQSQNGKEIFKVQFLSPTQLDALYIQKTSATEIFAATSSSLKLQGSNDNTNWTDLTAAITRPANATNITANGAVSLTNSNKFSVTTDAGKYKYYRIYGFLEANILAGIASEFYFDVNTTNYQASYFPKTDCSNDTDGDGILNHLDLDSDGDGCADAIEAGSSATATSISVYPTGSDDNTNGLLNVYEGTTAGTISYTSKYSPYAISKNLAACRDTDADGIADDIDLDDDNDGILDAIESPDCFYTANEWKYGARSDITVTSPLTMIAGQDSPQKLVNGLNYGTSYDVRFAATTGSVNVLGSGREVYKFDMKIPVKLSKVYLGYVNTATQFGASTVISLRGSNDGVNWTNLNTGATYDATIDANSATETSTISPYPATSLYSTNANIFSVTQNAAKYQYYDIYWVSGGAISVNGYANEVYFDVATDYNSSAHPKVSCTNDTDGDGILNHQDLDSDGDACPDAKEAGIKATLTSATVINLAGATIASGTATSTLDNAIVSGTGTSTFGNNGFVNSLETASETGIYSGTYNYSFATNKLISTCLDSDGDGVSDNIDLDDDNDGVLDIVECPAPGVTPLLTRFDIASGASKTLNMTGFPEELWIDVWTIDNNFNLKVNGVNITNVSELNFDPMGGNNMYSVPFTDVVRSDGSPIYPLNSVWLYPKGAQYPLIRVKVNKNGYSKIYGYDFVNGTGNYQELVLVNAVYQKVPINLSGNNAIVFGQDNTWAPSNLNAEFNSYSSAGFCDTDGDGVENRLDLDSDNDGCSDAYESKTTTSTDANFQYANNLSYDTNGFLNTLETSENGIYNGYYPYDFAINSGIKGCLDSDGDGVPDLNDLDDDNDGILDAVESPTCFYTLKELAAPVAVSSDLLPYDATATYALSNSIDDLTSTYSAFKSGQFFANKEILKYTANGLIDITSLTLDLDFRAISTDAASTFRFQGSADNVIWDNLNTAAVSSMNYTPPATLVLTNNLQAGKKYKYFRLYGVAGTSNFGGVANATFNLASSNRPSANPKLTCTNDTDGDGIPNQLDLDSDGDTCPDAKEAGVVGTLTTGNVVNLTNPNAAAGTATSTSTNVPSAVATGTYGLNGFADALETATESGLYSGTFNYDFAISKTFNACTDTDSDGIPDLVDIDDDNDGILDAVESPTCFYNTVEMTKPTAISTDLLPYSTTVIGNAIDADLTSYSAFALNQNWVGKTLFNLTANAQIPISGINLSLINWALSNPANTTGNTFKLQGSNDNNIWTDLSIAISSDATTGIVNIPNTLATISKFKFYQIVGVAGASYYAGVKDINFVIASSYVQSQYTKPTCLTGRNDADLIPNHLDLDSDGDGCSDALEAGTTSSTTANFKFTSTNNIADFGANGFYNTFEKTAAESNLYKGIYTYDYATDNNINACSDFDADGAADLFDLDDDNDGVLDAIESPTCFYNLNQLAKPIAVSTELAPYSTTVIGSAIDTDLTSYSAFAPSISWVNKEIFKFTAQDYIAISGITFNLVNWALSSDANQTFKLQGSGDNMNWTDLSAASSSTTNSATYTISNTLATTSKFKYFRLLGVAGNTHYGGVTDVNFNLSNTTNLSAYPMSTCTTSDTDVDGIPNYKDLDSDGDGCSDAKEAGVIGTLSSGSLKNGTGGAVTSTITNAFAIAGTAGSYGANGFANGVESATESGIYSGTYTYYYAIDNKINTCSDTDGDGILDYIDIDDDNDGILDYIEQTCTSASMSKTNVTVSSAVNWTFQNAPTGLYALLDGSLIQQLYPTDGAIANKTVFQFNFLTPKVLNLIELANVANQIPFVAGGTYKIQGSSDGTNWNDIVSSQVVANTAPILATTNSIKFDMPNNWKSYVSYRIYAISMTGQANWSTEVYFREVSCVDIDSDGDGTLNKFDLDSDGDACSDAVEAGTAPIGTTAFGSTSFFNPATTGANGFANSLETATESGIYSGTYKYVIALSSALSACLDTDGDGVSNIYDIDDDNDGITDLKELNCTLANSTDGTCTDALKSTFNYGIFTHCSGWYAFDFDPSPSVIVRADFDYMGVSGTDPYFDLQGSYTTPISGKMVKSFATTAGLSYTFEVGLISVFKDDPTTGSKPYLRAIDASTGEILGTTYLNGSGVRTVSFTGIGSSTLITLGYDIGIGNIGSLFWKGGKMTQNGEAYQICSIQDTDNDGVPNQLDLDSDGDACPDAVEAGTTAILSSGVASSAKLTASIIPAPYGNNGFANGLETTSESGAYTGTYTYNYAIDATISGCKDTDGDGVSDIIDLDDDNDGVLDTIEYSCSVIVVNKTGAIITKPSTINYNFNGTIANLIDGVDNNVYVIYGPSGTLNGPWLNFEFPSPKALTYLEIGHYVNQTLFTTTSTYKIEGSSNNTNWTDVSGTLTYNNNATSTSGGLSNYNSNIANFPNNKTAYKYYRIVGINASSGGTWATEIYFKELVCGIPDLDGDGIPNRLDLDSDGDGCPDAVESGATAITNSGVASSAKLTATTIPAPYGNNGFANGLETASESGAYSGTYTYNFVTDAALNSCLDTDGDGVPNVGDLDDDNDGVLDSSEQINCVTSAIDLTTLTFNGSSISAKTASSFTTAGGDTWKSSYSNENLKLPISLKFKHNSTTGYEMFGLFPINKTQTPLSWDDGGYKFYPQNSVTYGYFTGAWDFGAIAISSTDVLSIDISATGYVTATINGVTQKAFQGVVSDYKLAVSSYRASSLTGIILTDATRPVILTCTELDTDTDGIPNRLDLDSDGDGCSDAVEASSSNTATSISAFPTGTDTNGNGLLNVYESASAGVVSYTSTYATNALDNTKNRCTLNNNYTITTPAALCATSSSPGVLFSSSNVVLQSGTSGSTSIKWQRSTDGGANWADIVGGANATDAGVTYTNFSSNTSTVPYLTFSAAPLSINAYKYRIVSTNVIGYSAYSNAVAITVNTIPTITTQPANSVKCTTAATSFSTVANGGTTSLTYQWQVNTNTSSPTWTNITAGNLPNHTDIIYSGYTSATLNLSAAPATANNYQYRVIVTNSCGSATSSSTILNPTPIAPNITAGGALAICEGSSVTLSTTQVANVSYQWYKNSVLIGGATTTSLVVAQSGVYSLTAKLAGGCTIENSNSAAATTVVVNPIPTASITQGAVLTLTSAGASIVLTVSTNAITPTYIWYTAAIGSTTWSVVAGQTTNNLTVSAAGQYKASVVSSTGCSVLSDITTVSVLPAPSITGSTIFCAPGSVIISINKETGQTATWEQNTIGGSSTSWTTLFADASSTTSSTYTATTTGSYRVVLSGSSGVNANGTSENINVTVNPLPTPIITASATSICAGESISLTGSVSPSYQWLLDGAAISGATSATFIPTLSGAYALKVIDANTCQGTSSSTSIVINPLPTTPNISATTANFCYPGSVNLTSYQPAVTTGITYEWHTVSSNPTISTLVGTYTQVTTEGTYYLYAKSSTGCYSLASSGLVVTNTTLVQAITTASNQIYNLNATANDLTAGLTNPSYELRWYDALTSGSLLSAPVTPLTTTAGVTNYYVEQYDPLGTGCMSSPRQLVTVTVKPLAPGITPNARIVGQTITYCYGASASTLTATGTNLKWYTSSVGGTASTTAPTVLTGTATTTSYFVSQTVNGVESDRSEIITIVNAALAGTSSITGSTTVVSGMRSSYSITPVADAVSYTWTLPTSWVGSPILNVNDVIIGSSGGSISVKYTDANGCVSPITTLNVDLDSDGDGIFDGADLDDDNDGILDTIENAACTPSSTTCDSDGDGIPNNLDLDSDGDGITDARESNGIDLDGNGRVDGAVDANGVPASSNGGVTPADTDGDGKKNPYDTDSDGDGIPDSVEKGTNANNPVDTDGDLIPDYLDTDSDNDGIPDAVEKGTDGATPVDTDGDGTPDYLDTDSDNDGIPDSVEKGTNGATPVDTDGDGIPDYRDTDSDNDGIPDSVEKGTNGATPVDTDGDGTPDYLDTDSDNDGIPDSVEKGTNGATPVDTDGDGTPDYLDTDSDNDGIPDSVEKGTNGATPVDTDGDGTPDYLDTDSDNDGIPDSVEKGTNGATPVDTDGDGIPDYRDTDSDNDGIPDSVEKGTNGATPVDTDGDGTPDYRDTDSDNDGIPDSVEKGTNGATPVDTDGDGIPDYRDLDSDGDGILDAVDNCRTEQGVASNNGCPAVGTLALLNDAGTAYINIPTSGNISTNDVVPAGTTYGQPAQQTGATININANGTYSFTATAAGTYTYTVPVCAPGQTTNCPTEILVITVPVKTLNDDAQTAYANIPSSGNISANDVVPSGTTYGQPAQITGATITVNANGTYSFTATVAGTYTYTVPVCAPGQTTNCPTEILVITVPVNTLTNDAQTAYVNIPTSGNISTNDVVPAGTTYGQPAQQTGATITVNANGTYSFTATTAGTYTYTVPVCAPGQTTNCPTEILVITVPVNTLTNDAQTAYVNIPTSGNISTNDVVPAGTTYGQPAQQTGATITVNANGTYSFTATTAGTYTYTVPVCAPGQTTNCPTEILVITVPVINIILPDFNVTNTNVPVNGNISTNDQVPTGTSYGQPASNSNNPIGSIITINSNGTYTFNATNPGTYTFYVPTCAPGQTSNCSLTPLVITVVEPLINTNPPIANIDIATTTVNTPIKTNVLANDKAANLGGSLNPSSLSIPTQPKHGEVVVNKDGTITYTPTAGFVGTDSLIYSVCDNSTPLSLCKTAVVYYTVNSASSNNATTAADDFANTKELSSVSGNVLANDKNTAGAALKVTSIPTVPTSKGELKMNADGSYVFTPAAGFTGTLDLIYTVCGGTPEICVNATLHILVEPILRKKVLDITKVANSAKMNLDGSFNVEFIIKIKNLTSDYLDSILVKDDLTKVFTDTRGLSIVSMNVSGKLIKNTNYDGILNTDLLSIESALDPNKEDSIILTIHVDNNLSGIFANTAVVTAPTSFGNVKLNSTDPTVITSPTDSSRKSTLFKIPLVEVIIPGGFSPNNDGIDDTWKIQRPFGTKISVQVFNRWGNEVYSNSDYKNDWRGIGVSNFMGENVVEGTYFYIVLATDRDGAIKKFAGSLTIVR